MRIIKIFKKFNKQSPQNSKSWQRSLFTTLAACGAKKTVPIQFTRFDQKNFLYIMFYNKILKISDLFSRLYLPKISLSAVPSQYSSVVAFRKTSPLGHSSALISIRPIKGKNFISDYFSSFLIILFLTWTVKIASKLTWAAESSKF